MKSYSKYGKPVSRDLFTQYALAFQKELVPAVEIKFVTEVEQRPGGFELRLNSGEIFEATKIIVATGLDYMAHTPAELLGLPTELRSHSADHYDLSNFKEKEVVVIGGGQSGLETAAILREEGASVRVLVRKSSLSWNPSPSFAHRSIYRRLRNPRTRLGDGRDLWLYDNYPGLFHYLPSQSRRMRASTNSWSRRGLVAQRPRY